MRQSQFLDVIGRLKTFKDVWSKERMKQTDTSKTLANAFTDWVDVLGREVARLYEAGTLQFTIKRPSSGHWV